MSSPSLPPWPSPSSTPPPGVPFGPPPNSTGAPPPPPPPPPGPTDTATANYIFGFVITLVVLLLLFVACGIGSWRRFRIVGTALDERLQDMEGGRFRVRKHFRRRLVRPVFCETWTYPKGSLANPTPPPSEKNKWVDVQPISAAFILSRSKSQSTAGTRKPDALASRRSGLGVGATLRSYIFPRSPHYDHPPKPPPPERRPPEAVQVAVMIAMPFPSSMASPVTDGPGYVGHSRVGEYEIGVVWTSWP